MTDQPHPKALPPATPAKTEKAATFPNASHVPTNAPAGDPVAFGEPKAVEELTPAEQMALFEKELKEKDWGHQPC